ncbi:membrane protein [Paludibacter propionicigenes WB4]|uniref:Membrane protein n=1 Tax=Paludibacter propionicigenes (strain DSM 17365 / JCM 13257 / WB4) TaxID=694427 RepID=E4T631_PALPW|nr:hypothetical protein [Paludibacter propionicigenes]ADQ80175.1 membrane protein [Paludibacter propionicigenes WB4]
MSKSKKESFFWTSYSDLMTSLFFVMLVLFVLVIVMLHKKIEGQAIELNRLNWIRQIDEQFKPLTESKKFIYFPQTKKFVAKDLIGQEIFQPTQTNILPQYINTTLEIGKDLERLLKKLSAKNHGISYQLVIEGNMANTWNKTIDKNNISGYKTSYERALAVYLLWYRHGIDFSKNNTEVLICGSGYGGFDRDTVHEENNKRFTIQIIPKVSSPETTR